MTYIMVEQLDTIMLDQVQSTLKNNIMHDVVIHVELTVHVSSDVKQLYTRHYEGYHQ
jgi:adenylylsulfate kinase-like enzyme